VVVSLAINEIPKIVVTLPGPKSVELMRLGEKYVPKAVYNVTPIFVAKSEGALIKDVDGNEYIDFATGISFPSFSAFPNNCCTTSTATKDSYRCVRWSPHRTRPSSLHA